MKVACSYSSPKIALAFTLWVVAAQLPAYAADGSCNGEKVKLEPLVIAARHAQNPDQIVKKASDIGLRIGISHSHDKQTHYSIFSTAAGVPGFGATFDTIPGGLWRGAFVGTTCETIDEVIGVLGPYDKDIQERVSHSWIWHKNTHFTVQSISASTDFNVMTRVLDRHISLIAVGYNQ